MFRRLFVFSLFGKHREDGTHITRIRDDGNRNSFRSAGYQPHIDAVRHPRLCCKPMSVSTVILTDWRLVDCSVIRLTFGMKLEELIMETGRTTSIPVGHFRKEQADGGHATADPRWWCMRCSEWLGVVLCAGHNIARSGVVLNVLTMWPVYKYEWSSRGYVTGLKITTRSGPRMWLSLRLVSGLYSYSFRSVSFSLRILCHSHRKLVWFGAYFSGFSRLKWCVRL